MPVAEDPTDDFEGLREQHAQYLERLDDETGLGNENYRGRQQHLRQIVDGYDNSSIRQGGFSFSDMSSSPAGTATTTTTTGSVTTPSSSTSNARSQQQQRPTKPVHDLAIKPQFNLDSATRLLTTFASSMLPHMPCMVLRLRPEGPDEGAGPDVRSLARTRPFALLAVLAAASCSASLQGHSLYDEEFRKILALKFVAGGERSLELLQGLLIYCSW